MEQTTTPAPTPEATPAPKVTPEGTQTPEEKSPPVQENPKKVASRFAQLARQEKAIREKEAAVKQEAERIAAERAEVEEIRRLKAKAKENPFDYLKAAGIDLDYLVKYSLNDNKPPTERMIEDLKAEIENKFKTKEEQDRAERERERAEREGREAEQKKQFVSQQLDTFATEINQAISSQPEKFQQIIAEEKQLMVYEIIVDHFNQTYDPQSGQGQLLDPLVVAEQLEEELVAAEIEKAKKSPKLQRELAKAFGVKLPGEEKIELPHRQAWQTPKTLSNSQVESNPVANKPRSREERLAAAMSKLQYVQK